MRGCCKGTSDKDSKRHIIANNPTFNASRHYAPNIIHTGRYTLLNFLPKNLFEQFHRTANIYFLVLLFLQLMPRISSVSAVTTIIPLVTVLSITAIKDGVEDYRRHRSDRKVNGRKANVLCKGRLVEKTWSRVVVGDIVYMESDEVVAADLLLLSTSELNALCFVETFELDGETNLKVRQALPDTTICFGNDIGRLSSFNGEVVCEQPNNVLNKFYGVLHWSGKSYSLNTGNLLLRGCTLRNTTWCYGLVVFAGRDSKLLKNDSGHSNVKRGHLDRMLDQLIFWIVLLLLVICIMCSLGCGLWEALVGYDFQVYLPWEDYIPGSTHSVNATEYLSSGPAALAVMNFLAYVILLNSVVPISLYVSLELVRYCHNHWIVHDNNMCSVDGGRVTHTTPRTTALSEELGQIRFIFSDKTGTLTQNKMRLKRCSINGKLFGCGYDDQVPTPSRQQEENATDNNSDRLSMTDQDVSAVDIFSDERLMESIALGDKNVLEFMRLLALCHTVVSVETEKGALAYQAQSPDESALVSAAKYFGFTFKVHSVSQVTIEVLGNTEVYELLCILNFNDIRKRMSVLVKQNDTIRLYCKGADSTVYKCLHPSCRPQMDVTALHLQMFAESGLRTLCCAIRDVTPEYYQDWKRRHHAASISLENREELLEALYEEMERDMTLIGATAIDDKLQDGVPHTIAQLMSAGIHFWVLTGDKQETAVNIGYSCRLLSADDTIKTFVLDGETPHEVREQLASAREKLLTLIRAGRLDCDAVELAPWMRAAAVTNNLLCSPDVQSQCTRRGSCALVVNGHSLGQIIGNRSDERSFVEIACACRAVICCRLTPIQKAMIVQLVKRYVHTSTLAIGDGANDISMIKEADVGIGISGQEGNQAVLASDYSLAQFSFLERLLLVHGRWSYIRSCKFIRYFFYKNFAFTFCHLMYGFHCGFSAQTIFDSYFISFYNMFFTCVPCMMLAFYEQDVNEETSLRYPMLYMVGAQHAFFNRRVFLFSILEGIFAAFIIYFLPYFIMEFAVLPNGQDLADHKTFGTAVAAILVVAVTLRNALDIWHWTFFNHCAIWGSCIFYFGFCYVFLSDFIALDEDYYGTLSVLMSSVLFWLAMCFTVAAALLPPFGLKSLVTDVRPSLIEQAQNVDGYGLNGQPLLRTRLKPTRWFSKTCNPPRSGYAFSYDEDCGRMVADTIQVFSSTQSLHHNPQKEETQSSTLLQKLIPTSASGVHLVPQTSTAIWQSVSDVDGCVGVDRDDIS